MPNEPAAPDVTMANTKKQMLDAYLEMKRALAVRDKAVIDAEKERNKFRKEAAQAAVERAVAEDPVLRIHDLRSTIGHELSSVAEQFEATVQDYELLKKAAAEKQAEIERIYGVETAAADLAALIEAHAERKSAFQSEVALAQATWDADRLERETAVASAQASLSLQREREQEAYDYNLDRERLRRRNELDDEQAALEREIANKRAEAARALAKARDESEGQIARRDEELARREQVVADREQHMNELEQRVAAASDLLAGQVASAVEDASARLDAEHKAQLALVRKEHEGERNVLASRTDSLQQLLEQQARQIETLTGQQERAYAQVQDIASKALEGAQRSSTPLPAPLRQTRMADEEG